jgi:hypothetical protein
MSIVNPGRGILLILRFNPNNKILEVRVFASIANRQQFSGVPPPLAISNSSIERFVWCRWLPNPAHL